MTRVIVRERVYVTLGELTQAAQDALCKRFRHENPQYHRIAAMGYRPDASEPPVYHTWKDAPLSAWGPALSFPRGGMSRIRCVLQEHGVKYVVEDQRVEVERIASIPEHRKQLRPYQEASVQAALKRQNCIVRAPTGSGKTTAAIGFIARLKTATLVQVWSGNLMDQWIDRLESELGMRRKDIGIIRGGKVRLAPVTIGMQQTIASLIANADPDELEQLLNYFGAVVCDEVQRFAAPTLFASVDPFPAKYRIGVSADETRKDKKEFLTYDLFGDVAHEVPRADLVNSGDVLDVKVCIVPTLFRAPWYKSRPDWNRLLKELQENEPRNQLALQLALEEVKAGEQVLIISHRVEHCYKFDHMLAIAGVRAGVLIGGAENAAAFEESRAALLGGTYRVAVGTLQAIGQGLDIPSMSRMVVTTPIAKNRQQENQVKGRICRPSEATGKKGARYYYLWDQYVHGLEPVQNLVKWNRHVTIRMEDGTWVEAREYLARVRKFRNLDVEKKEGTHDA